MIRILSASLATAAEKPLIVAADATWPPMEMLDENKNVVSRYHARQEAFPAGRCLYQTKRQGTPATLCAFWKNCPFSSKNLPGKRTFHMRTARRAFCF